MISVNIMVSILLGKSFLLVIKLEKNGVFCLFLKLIKLNMVVLLIMINNMIVVILMFEN